MQSGIDFVENHLLDFNSGNSSFFGAVVGLYNSLKSNNFVQQSIHLMMMLIMIVKLGSSVWIGYLGFAPFADGLDFYSCRSPRVVQQHVHRLTHLAAAFLLYISPRVCDYENSIPLVIDDSGCSYVLHFFHDNNNFTSLQYVTFCCCHVWILKFI